MSRKPDVIVKVDETRGRMYVYGEHAEHIAQTLASRPYRSTNGGWVIPASLLAAVRVYCQTNNPYLQCVGGPHAKTRAVPPPPTETPQPEPVPEPFQQDGLFT